MLARTELGALQEKYNSEVALIDKDAEAVRIHNAKVSRFQAENREDQAELNELNERRRILILKLGDRDEWLKENAVKPEPTRPAPLDTAAIDSRINAIADTSDLETAINAATANEVRREQYIRNVARAEARDADNRRILDLEKEQRELKDKKIAKLASYSETCGVPGMSFDEHGSFSFEGSTPGMLSTSQVMRLSEYLSALYPEGFSLSLIDRGESLGKSVFGLAERAKKEEKTIMVTVVGEKPAKIPDDVGVFVVENGMLK
jgi:hypothetical protein